MSLPKPRQENKPPPWFKDGYNARPIVRDGPFAELTESVRRYGILQPIGALETGERIFGNRRFAAGVEAGLELLPVLIYPSTLTPSQIKVINLTENVQRVDLSEPETYAACSELMKLNPEWSRKDLAAHLGKDPSTVTRWLSPDDLIPEAKQAFLDGKFGFAKAYAIAKLPHDQQGGLLALTLSGATRDVLEQQGRRKRTGAAPTVRASKIKVPLVSGQVVTVAGEEISLEEAIEAASEAVKQMKQAVAKGLNAKTAMNVWKDIAAAG